MERGAEAEEGPSFPCGRAARHTRLSEIPSGNWKLPLVLSTRPVPPVPCPWPEGLWSRALVLAAELLALPLSGSYSFPSQGGSWWFYQPVASLQFSLHVTQRAFCGASSCSLRELSASSKLQRVNVFGYNTQFVPR